MSRPSFLKGRRGCGDSRYLSPKEERGRTVYPRAELTTNLRINSGKLRLSEIERRETDRGEEVERRKNKDCPEGSGGTPFGSRRHTR